MNDRQRRPHLGSNFRVEIDEGNGRVLDVGFSEVVFPTFRVPADAWKPAVEAQGNEHLILRRATCGGLELYAWWDAARRGRAPRRRTVRITLLANAHATEVLRWRFRNARPIALSYSPLQAMESTLVIESIELAFDAMEMG